MATCKEYWVGNYWRSTVDYVTAPEKTDWRVWQDRFPGVTPEPGDPVILIQGIHCDPWTAKEEFEAIHRQFDREHGNRVLHVMVSFKGREASPWNVQRLGMELIRSRYGDRHQAVVATHLNTPNLHFHAAVNMVPFTGGAKIRGENSYLFRFKAEELAGKYGIENVQKQARLRYARMKERETLGYPTDRNLLRYTVDALIPCSRDLDDLFALLERAGYRYYVNGAGAWVTVRSTDGRSLCLDCLGPDYLPDALREKIRANRETRPLRPPEWTDPGWKQYPFPRREELLAERTGPDRLWLCARCAAGYLPICRTRMGKVAPLALRFAVRDVKNMERETAFLLCHPEISFDTLSARDTELTEQISNLMKEWKMHYMHAWHSNRGAETKNVSPEEKLNELSGRMAPLRYELRMIRAVKKRHPVLTDLMGEAETGVPVPVRDKDGTEKEEKFE